MSICRAGESIASHVSTFLKISKSGEIRGKDLLKSGPAGAGVTVVHVCTIRIIRTWGVITLVDILAVENTIATESLIASTVKATGEIGARSFYVAVVASSGTFILIVASKSGVVVKISAFTAVVWASFEGDTVSCFSITNVSVEANASSRTVTWSNVAVRIAAGIVVLELDAETVRIARSIGALAEDLVCWAVDGCFSWC